MPRKINIIRFVGPNNTAFTAASMKTWASGNHTVSIPTGKMYFVIRTWSDPLQYQLQARCNGTSSTISWSFNGPAKGIQLDFIWNNWWGGAINCFSDRDDREVLVVFVGRNYTSAAEEERNVLLLKSRFDFPTISV